MKESRLKQLDKYSNPGDITRLARHFQYSRQGIYNALKLKSNSRVAQQIRSFRLNELHALRTELDELLSQSDQLIDIQ